MYKQLASRQKQSKIVSLSAEYVWSDDWVEYSGHTYKYFAGGSLTHSDAVAACRAEGGLLVSINDQKEMEFVTENVLYKRTLSAFIGATDADEGY